MRALERTMGRFEDWLVTETGRRFRGVILPAPEGSISTDSFVEPRLLMRVRSGEGVRNTDIITDPSRRPYLVAEHDRQAFAGEESLRSHKLFAMTDKVSWTRTRLVKDPVTQQDRSDGEVELGPIWIALEMYGRLEMDRGVRVSQERRRVITGAPLKLNDRVDGAVVKRLNDVFGVFLAEIQ